MTRRERFELDGFLGVPGFLSPRAVEDCRRELGRYVAEVLPGLPPEEVFFEDKEDPSTLKQLQRMHLHDAWFGGLFDGAPRRLAEELLGAAATGENLQYFNKPPGAGRPTPPHQDGFYFKLDPPAALTMWLALDPVDGGNGCVRYVRGSHRRGMRPHGPTGTLGFSQGITDFGGAGDLAEEVAMPAAPGDLLAHHALTIHRAGGNTSATRSRRALGFIYYAENARVDPAARAAYRQELAAQQRGRL